MHSYREIVGKLIQLNALKRISTHRAASEIGLYDGQMPLLETLERDGCLTQKALADRAACIARQCGGIDQTLAEMRYCR